MTKSLIYLAIASGLSLNLANASDNSLIIRIPTSAKLSSWTGSDPIYHPWVNEGSHYNCVAWSPLPNTVNFGQNFTQTRDCDQDQKRDVEIRELDSFSNVVKTVRVEQEDRTITETESQGAVGEYRNWVSHASTFTEWADFGADYDHTTWSPVAAAQTADFTQSRDYKHDQERFEQKREFDTVTEDIRNINDPIRHTQITNRNESRPVDVNVTPWSDVGTHYNCAAWAPTPEEVDVYQAFTQTRDCSQNQTRRWTYVAGGSEIHARNEAQTITEVESQPSVGTRRNWVSHDSTFTAWADQGATHSYTPWTPTPASQTAAFTQTRTYKQPQERFEQKREIDAVSGEIKDVGELIRHAQDDSRSENRSIDVSWTAWSDTMRDGYGAWGPVAYNETTDFTQTRVYGQHQIRDRVYAAGSTELSRFEENRVVSPLYENRAVSVTVNAWSDTTRGSYSSWTPVATTQTANFTQSRTYTQNQERTWSYKTGGADLSSRIETRGVANQSESQTVTVSWSAWTNTGAHYTCGTWTPTTNTVAYGESFTQTRSCKQDQTRSRIYKVGSTTINTVAETQTINETESQSAVGAGSWASTTSTFTAWVNSGAGYSYGTWAPAAGAQTANYTQTRSYSQDQTRTEQKREVDTIGGTIRNVGTPIAHSQTITPSESQSVAVTASAWANTTTSAHTAWSPAASAQTASFTQSRTYTQAQSRTWTHKVGTTTIHTRGETQSLTGQSESRTVTVSWSGWSNSGAAYGHTTWSPAPAAQTANFTQTRGFSQDQTRTRTYSSGESFTESQTLTSGTESRTVNVSWTAWANSGGLISCGTYSPAATTQTATFTQTRSCSQAQTRTRNYTVSGTNVGSAAESQTLTGISDSRSVTVSWSGWTNSGSPSSCGTWSPATSTVTWGQAFTQTRSCTQGQVRNRSYSSGESYQESQGVSVTQSQGATGTSDYIASYTYGTWSGWSNSGGVYSCSAWSPATSTVCSGSGFTQTRSCSQDQTRSRSVTAVWASGATSSAGTESGSQTISSGQSQSATGSQTCWAPASSDIGNWVDSGGIYSCGAWSPSPSTVNYGQSFTQSRTCSQNQTRTITYREYNSATGQYRTTGTSSESRAISLTQSQSAVGTMDYVVNSDYREYYTTYSEPSCGPYWTGNIPAMCGVSYTGTRTCTQNISNSYHRYLIYASGAVVYSTSVTYSGTKNSYTEETVFPPKPCTGIGDIM